MKDLLQVGVITSTHGLRGEVKVFPTTDEPKRFKKLKEAILDTGKERLKVEIESTKFFKKFVILKMKGFDSIEDVENLRQKSLYVTREHAVKLKANEYFVADLIGMTVATDEGEHLGILKDVLQTGANDVYVIESDRYGEVLIPAIRDCILEVDTEEGRMKVHLLDGLI
ncbi:MAG: ribosome maturation factor RimM [Ruminococcus sp.]|jgi:16S rRNA processing protein RimM